MAKVKKFLKTKSLRRQWVFSYLCMLLVTVIVIIAVYILSAINIKKDRESNISINTKALENLQIYIDDKWSELILFYYDLTRDSSFMKIVNSSKLQEEFRSEIITFLLELNKKNFSEKISYVIYFPERDYMVWDGMVYSSKIIYKTQNILKCSGLEYEEWIHYVSDEYESDFIDTGVYENEVYGSSVVYANTMKGNNKNTVNVFISIPKSEIDKIIAASEVSNHIVIAKEDRMLFSTWQENDEWSTDVNWWKIGESNIDGFTVLSKMSRNIKIKYLLLMPENRYDQREMINNGMLFGGLMIVLLTGVVGVYLLLSRNFKKIEAILSKFGMNTQNKSEFEQIESMMDQLYSDNNEIRRRIEKQENQILEKKLLEIMQRKYFDVKPVGLLLPSCQVNDNMFLLALKIENDEKTEKAKGLTWNAINCAFCEMVKGEQFYYTSDDRCQLYLFTFSENKEYKNEIILKAEFLCDFVKEKLGEKVVAAISEIDNNLEHISKLYDAVREAFEYRKLTGGNGIIDCDKITNSASVWEEAFDVGNRLMYALEDGNYDFVQECLAEVFEFFEEASFPIVKGVVLHMYSNILEKLFERECSEVQRIRMIGYLNPLVSADSTRSIEKVLREVLDEFYKLIVKQKDSDLVEKVRQYITEHYWEDALNINQIAEVLRENSRMLSKTFRDETGEGILDYISRERIKQAVILLNENKYSLEVIGEMVGYASYKSFRRAFMKITGTTPGKYAKLYFENDLI